MKKAGNPIPGAQSFSTRLPRSNLGLNRSRLWDFQIGAFWGYGLYGACFGALGTRLPRHLFLGWGQKMGYGSGVKLHLLESRLFGCFGA